MLTENAFSFAEASKRARGPSARSASLGMTARYFNRGAKLNPAINS
jgi:hypothetical protein